MGIEDNEWHGLFDDAGGVAERFGALAGRANGFDRRGFPPEVRRCLQGRLTAPNRGGGAVAGGISEAGFRGWTSRLNSG